MSVVEYASLIASTASLILAVLAIWLGLYHKKEIDEVNRETRNLLMDIRGDAKTVSSLALPEMRAYGETMRQFILSGPNEKNSQITLTSETPKLAGKEESDPLVALTELVSEMSEGEGYSAEQRNASLRLATLVSKDHGADNAAAMLSIETLIDIFVASDQYDSLEMLHELFGEHLLENRGIVVSLLNYYSLLVIGERPEKDKARVRFDEASKAADKLDMQEYSFHSRLVIEHSLGNKGAVKDLLQKIRAMDAVKRLQIKESFERRKDHTRITRSGGAMAMKVSEMYKDFIATYPDHFEPT